VISRRKVLLSLGILTAAVGVAAIGWLPIVASAILGCIALIASRCISNDQAYQAVDWRVIMLLAGVLPLGIALQKSGIADAVAGTSVELVGHFGPLAVLAVIYLITAVLTEMMSNNAAAVLITPIAYSSALSMDVSPTPFLVAVMFAASTSFATPVGYQTNTMVYNAGGYKFTDFMKFGIPLNVLFWILAIVFIPRYFPF
jgi:di/tricarboxylate transporter